MKTIEVNTFNEVDIRGLRCPIIAVYINPKDYPNKVVARVFDLEDPTNILLTKDNLEETRKDIIKSFPHMVRFDRAKNDPRSIVETWI